MKSESWLGVDGFPVYEVSDRGRVRNKETGHILKPFNGRKGYLRVSLNQKMLQIHRLVLAAFVGPCPEKFVGAHIDGDKRNNTVENLKWASHKENESHKRQHGTALLGEKCPSAKLTEDIVRKIRLEHRPGTNPVLAKKYGVGITTIRHIIIGKTWTHVK